MPRFGIDPRAAENDSVSSVRLISRTLSFGPVAGLGSGVGLAVKSCGRKIVFRPLPLNVPVKPAMPPSGGAAGAAAAANCSCVGGTSPHRNPRVCSRVGSVGNESAI
jgi:hypothetical protein